jgi:hypothetical protein
MKFGVGAWLEAGLPEAVKTRNWRKHLIPFRRFWYMRYVHLVCRSALKWIKRVEAKGRVVPEESRENIRECAY